MSDAPGGTVIEEPRDSGEFKVVPPAARGPLWAVAAASVLGAVFSLVSTSDFMNHLDRQVHSIHCSFIPGAGAELGESGCRTVMMSPYSSFFRESLWGGIPVSLWSLAVFAFLASRATSLALKGTATRGEANFLLAATGLPLAMTVIYGLLSMVKVGATCKVCVGIYVASVAAFAAAFVVRQRALQAGEAWGARAPYPLWFAEGCAFVLALTGVYLAFTPGSAAAAKAQGCGALVQGEDPSGVMVELSNRGRVPAIEVLDPLCPACRAFDTRLAASSIKDELDLKGILFPLDNTCNWMVTEPVHPGACLVSEAVLCANGLEAKKDPEAARRVLRYAFAHQEPLRELAKKNQAALKAKLEREFPEVFGCLGGAAVKNKLTKSLHWAVANAIPVLTPQLFVRDRRLCDEDTDLGLEYSVRRAISRPAGKGGKR